MSVGVLDKLTAGMVIPFGGDRAASVPAALADAFRPGDRLIVVQDTGDLLHVPSTAQAVAKQVGVASSLVALTNDPAHNMRLGTTYLQEMLDRFGNSLPLAIAAYNAGPHRVDQWLPEIGDPRVGPIDMLDWIELIPINETRNYVQRVLENVVIYRARRGESTPTLLAQWTQ